MNRVAVVRNGTVETVMTAPDWDAEPNPQLAFASWVAKWTGKDGPYEGRTMFVLRADQTASPGDTESGGVFTRPAPAPKAPLEADADAAISELRTIRLRDMTAAQVKRLLAVVCYRVGIDVIP